MAAFVLSDDQADYRFIHFFLQNMKLGNLASTTALPSLSGSVLREIRITLPPTTAEQEAIAAVLSAMDAEIALLEAQLAKYRQLKQGLMQNLLTGGVRLMGRAGIAVQQSPGMP